jgi:hypothetical protein
MTEKTSGSTGKYLYAIVGGAEARDYGHCGIDSAAVYTISEGMVAAVVSDIPGRKIRPERRHLATHQTVLKRLMEESVPLPVSFGIIINDCRTVEKILSRNQKTLQVQLRRVAGKVEMGLRVAWNVPNIFEYFIHVHPELRSARDRFFGGRREPSQEDKIELGRMFDHLHKEDREQHTAKVEDALSGRCSEITRNRCRDEREVMHLACLVDREAQQEFEKGIFEAARLFDDSFSFDFSGPWPPHNFVNIDLKL